MTLSETEADLVGRLHVRLALYVDPHEFPERRHLRYQDRYVVFGQWAYVCDRARKKVARYTRKTRRAVERSLLLSSL